jgi:ATP-dependent helicase/nuclease subunit A
VDPTVTAALAERLAWQYPYASPVEQPAKLSVSRLRRNILAEALDEEPQTRTHRSRASSALGTQKLNAAEIGSAHHKFLQLVSLDRLQDMESLRAEAQRLQAQGILTPEERGTLDLDAIRMFWKSSVGQDVLRHRDCLERELPFTARLALTELHGFHQAAIASLQLSSKAAGRPAVGGQFPPSPTVQPDWPASEFVIVTGVVDLAVILPTEIWFLDFKTDTVELQDWSAKVRLYEPQLVLYSLALSRIYGRPVSRAWLHSLPLGQSTACRTTLPSSFGVTASA